MHEQQKEEKNEEKLLDVGVSVWDDKKPKQTTPSAAAMATKKDSKTRLCR